MTGILIALFILHVATGYRIVQPSNSLNNAIGTLYLSNLGSTKVFCRHRAIEIEIEMDDTQSLKKDIDYSLNLLGEICSETRFHQLCKLTVTEIKLIEETLIKKEQSIKMMTPRKRRRRQMEEFENLLERSIKLNDFSYSELKQSIEELKRVTTSVIKTHNRMIDDLDYINFTLLSQLIEFNLKRRTNFLDLVLEIIINSNHKKLLDIIPLNTLQSELNDLQSLLRRESCQMPININLNDIAKYLRLSKIRAEIHNSNLIISVDIPTFFETTFKLVEAVSIPFTHNWDSYIVRPVFPYYLVYDKNDTFQTFVIPISLEEKMNCTGFSGLLLCYPTKAIQIINTAITGEIENVFHPGFPSCKTRIPEDFEQATKVCNYQMVPHLNQIIRLTENDYFIYIVMETSLMVICNENHRSYTINSSTMIRDIEDNCSIYFEHGIHPEHKNLIARSIYHSNINVFYSITRKDLILKEPSMPSAFDTRKSHQSEHMELNEQVQLFSRRHKVVQNILKTKEFILIGSILLILLTGTWLCIICCNLNLNKKITRVLNRTVKTDSPESFLPNIRWHFKPDSPPLPPKLGRRKRSNSGPYDKPHSPHKRADVELQERAQTLEPTILSNYSNPYVSLNNDPQTYV